MTPEDINKVIAPLCGWEQREDGTVFHTEKMIGLLTPYHYKDLRFHTDWNWLMEALMKVKHNERMLNSLFEIAKISGDAGLVAVCFVADLTTTKP